MNQCIWAVLDISKDDEELRRFFKHHQVRKIETNIQTVRAQLNNLTYRDPEVFGMHLVPEWCDNNWKQIASLSEPVGQ